MHSPYLKQSQPGMYNLHSLQATWLVCSCRDKQEVRCRTCFNWSRLCYGCRRCTLAVAQHFCSPIEAIYYTAYEHVQFSGNVYAHLKFTVYGRKQTYACISQCSPTSVQLSKAHPNKYCILFSVHYCSIQWTAIMYSPTGLPC